MKSLQSIINSLSHHEIGTFRLFLSSHCRNGKNKKLELFDHLVTQTSKIHSSDPGDMSRQSVYQLKKRLKEDLYAFLVMQDQVKDTRDKLFLEMECHKKLYCFKILFDKGIHDHAYQVLTDVLTISADNALHSIYLEAVNIKNVYFPLAPSKVVRKIPFNQEIRKLRKNLGRNLYINQYLAESGSFLHENEDAFRRRLMDRLDGFDAAENEPAIDLLLEGNHLFYEKKYASAYDKVVQVLRADTDISADSSMRCLAYVELTKACISMHAISEARRWLDQAPEKVMMPTSFLPLLLELQFLIAVKSEDTIRLKALWEQSGRLRSIRENAILMARWSFYSLLMFFRERDFKKVIKVVNGDSFLLFKDRSWLMNAKMLELMSIYELNDSDWLYYKIENFRKIFSGTGWKQQRISQIVYLLKACASGKELATAGIREKILVIERDFPWHPLSNEVFNYCTYLEAMLCADSSHRVVLAESQSYASLPGGL